MAEAAKNTDKEKGVPQMAKVGEVVADGTIYAGISPDTKLPMYVAPVDSCKALTFNDAAEYAKNLTVGDKNDFYMPSKNELEVIFTNRNEGALKDVFNLKGRGHKGWFWSSSPFGDSFAWAKRFTDGKQAYFLRDKGKVSVRYARCIRSGP